jgi:cob(I)alamin adenosyltransferase
MPKLTKIYTKTGDEGSTSLGSKERVGKDSSRVEAYGDVDELNSAIGIAIAVGVDDEIRDRLVIIQNELFILGADLAFPQDSTSGIEVPRIQQRHVRRLEELIDEMVERTGPLQNFILPGGSSGAAHLHSSRAICRRAERNLVALSRQEVVSDAARRYINRLSDALFVLARYENYIAGVEEPLWDSHT